MVEGRKNLRKDLHLRCYNGFRYASVKQLLGLAKNIKTDLLFLMIWIIVWSELLTNLTINNKIPIILINGLLCTTIFLSYNILEFKIVEKFLGAHTFAHSVFNVRKIFNKAFTTLFFLISHILLPLKNITLPGSGHNKFKSF